MAVVRDIVPFVVIGTALACGIVIPLIIIANLARRLSSDASLPKDMPWAGVASGGGPLARVRANLRSFMGLKGLMDEGYAKYSKNNKAYVLPHILTGPEVVLPLSQARWLVEQPDTVMSQTEVNRQFLEADHTFLHPNIVREPVHPDVIRRELTHKLSSFTTDIVDELDVCLTENWGSDTENWREVKVYDTMLDVISRLSTRVFVGEQLCHNQQFLQAARTFDKNVVVSAAAINLLPGFLKPVVAPVFSAYDHLKYLTIAKFVLPLIKQRLEEHAQPSEKLPFFEGKRQNDYIHWAIDHAAAHWDPLEMTPSVIARRLACLCFAAIQSSVISITNTMFDIAASPHCQDHLDAMRDEIARQIDTAGGPGAPASAVWSKASLARMTRVDSALRESMRLNGFVARGIMKMVVAPGGVTLPDGLHVPRGTKVGIQAHSVHRDDDVYADAENYDPFRFCAEESGPDSAPAAARQPQALVSTSPTFLAFSHGPNACPGRFFAANQLKLTLAHIALHYEVEPLPARPVNKWFVGSMAPPMWETLRVRRRKTS